MKYIIQNCNVLYFNPDKTAICNDLNLECPCYCKERTDCVLKQIVEKCKDKIHIYEHYDTYYALGKVKCAESILQLLDIQECE